MKSNILLIEDDEDDYLILMESFKALGFEHEVRWMCDGDKALDFLSHLKPKQARVDSFWPDMILLDLNMPKMDGFEVLKEIKSDKRLRHIPVVILSTSKDRECVFRAYDLGVNAYIQKPSEYSQLVGNLRGLSQFWFEIVQMPVV